MIKFISFTAAEDYDIILFLMKRAHIFVSGRVQGVGYRAFVQQTAHSLDVAGRVKNLADGRVEILAEGAENDINTLINKLEEGPIGARVDNVNVDWEKFQGDHEKFRIAW
jgi:acylphosphatase